MVSDILSYFNQNISIIFSPLTSYDLQSAEHFREFGLEEFLVHELLDMGNRWNMEKVILTVLKGELPFLSNYALADH